MTRLNPSAVRTSARAIASVAVFVALLLGPPILLVRAVGWPLPGSIPGLDEIGRAARSGISDGVIVNTLAVIAWLAWAQIAIALLVEATAVVRGRPSIHLPVMPGIQTGAARLVASVAMMASIAHPSVALAGPVPLRVPAPVVQELVTASTPVAKSLPSSLAATAHRAAAPAPLPTVTVVRHDSYWGIAERTLGDGLRWNEVRDLNVGRTMTDGHVLLPGSDLLRPGWILVLPAGAQVVDAAQAAPAIAPAAPAQATTEVAVERGDSFWSIAEEHVAADLGRIPTDEEVRAYWTELTSANADRLGQPGNPSLVYVGQSLTLPRPPTQHRASPPPEPPPEAPKREQRSPEPPSDSERPPTPTTAVPSLAPVPRASPSTSPTTVGPRLEPAPATGADHDSGLPVPVEIAIGGLASIALAVGIKRALAGHRRRFTIDNPGETSSPTHDTERSLHRQVVANADDDAIDDLRSILGRLAEDLAEDGSSARPRIAQHGDDHLDLFLAAPSIAAPAGWTVDGDGSIWSFDGGSWAGSVTARCAAPLLVTIGQPEDGAQLYLDLEADGLISLAGDLDAARDLARSIIAEVALGPMTETVRVVVVGDLLETTTSNLEHVVIAGSWDEAGADVSAWAEQSHQALHENGWPNTFVGRGADEDHDALAPVVVVSSEIPPADVITAVAAKRPAAIALVAIGEFDGAACVIDCQEDQLTVVDLGLTCPPQKLDAETLAAVVRLLGAADEPADDSDDEDRGHTAMPDRAETALDLRDAGPADGRQPQLLAVAELTGAARDDESAARAGVSSDPEYEILVRLLGEITVDGGRPLTPKPTAVVAYIAVHGSVAVESLEDACWADPASGAVRKRLKDTMSECRASIGAEHLPAASGGRYAVGPGVVTDLELFDRRVARAANQTPAQAADTYRSALELVTGKVFTYPSRAGSSYTWIDLDNLVSQWELKIAGIAQQCAETYMAMDDPGRAIAVALRALQALPLHAGLTETLMRAHTASGNRRAVETVYRAHAEGLARIHGDDPAESTQALRRALGSDAEMVMSPSARVPKSPLESRD